MLNVGAGELIFILVIALLILGPTKLPEMARGVGKAIREFRRQSDEVRSVVEREFYRMDRELQLPKAPEGEDLAPVPRDSPSLDFGGPPTGRAAWAMKEGEQSAPPEQAKEAEPAPTAPKPEEKSS